MTSRQHSDTIYWAALSLVGYAIITIIHCLTSRREPVWIYVDLLVLLNLSVFLWTSSRKPDGGVTVVHPLVVVNHPVATMGHSIAAVGHSIAVDNFRRTSV